MWHIRKNIYHVLWNCDYIEYMKWDKNHLKNTLFSDVINIYANIISYSMNILADTLMILTFLAVSFYISFWTTLILLGFVLLGLLFSALIKPVMAKHSVKVNKELKKDNSVILLDEVESHLDKESKSIMDELEREILRNKENYIVIKISHENKGNKEMYNKVISL